MSINHILSHSIFSGSGPSPIPNSLPRFFRLCLWERDGIYLRGDRAPGGEGDEGDEDHDEVEDLPAKRETGERAREGGRMGRARVVSPTRGA